MKLSFLLVLIFSAIGIFSCDQTAREQANKFSQYYNRGEELYLTHCSNCHQVDGSGLGRLYPPLNKSDFMQNNLPAVLCLMRYGRSGELVVNGIEFNKAMPGIPELTDLEVAEIATYIYNAWDNKRHGIIDVRDVTATLNNCAAASD